jgi:hypothetical protein
MKMKKFNDLEVGDWVADMHGKNFRCEVKWNIDGKIEVVSHIEMSGTAWRSFINSSCGGRLSEAHNKLAYVIGESIVGGKYGVVVAYSYDGRRGGIAVLMEAE